MTDSPALDTLGESWKDRVGHYRIVPDILDKKLCGIAVHICNRKNVYEGF